MRRLLFFAAAVLFVAGCQADVNVGQGCALTSECSASLVCREGRCRVECMTSADCRPVGTVCRIAPGQVAGTCTLPDDSCASDATCEAGAICERGLCLVPCDTDACSSGNTCARLVEGGRPVCIATGSDAGTVEERDAGPSDAGSLDAAMPDAQAPDSGPRDAGPPRDAGAGCTADDCIVQVATSPHHACALRRDGRVVCWGRNDLYQAGAPSPGTDPLSAAGEPCAPPREVALLAGERAEQIEVSQAFSCARTTLGRVQCWGGGANGVLGLGSPAPRESTPGYVLREGPPMVALTEVREIALGRTFGHARLASGEIVAWGNNLGGPHGDGTVDVIRETAIVASRLPTDLVQLEAGSYFACGRRATGQVVCWGDNDFGQCGVGPGGATLDPRTIPLAASATDIALGLAHACAVLPSGELWCWGWDEHAQLGTACPGATSCATPVRLSALLPVAFDRVASAPQSFATCAEVADGSVYCWGSTEGLPGLFGAGVTAEQPTLRDVGEPLRGVVTAGTYGCGIAEDGGVVCWGVNDRAQLGRGAPSTTPGSPGRVLLPTL